MPAPIKDPKIHYMRYVQPDTETQCWIWTGALRARKGEPDSNKYGIIFFQGVSKGAHVYFFLWHGGVIPPFHEVGHTCNNKRCVNPAHLKAVTHSQNILDAYEDKLVNSVKGERHHSSKVTAEQVREMRRLYEEEKIGCVELGRKYGMSATAASNIIRRKTWTHV